MKAETVNLGASAASMLVGKVLGRALFLLTQVLLIRYLSPENFGLYSLGYTIFQILGLLAVFGLNNAVIHHASKHFPHDQRRFSEIVWISLVLALVTGLLIGVIVYLATPLLVQLFNERGLYDHLRVFAIGIPIFSVLRVASAATRATRNLKYSVIAEELVLSALLLSLVALVVTLRLPAVGGSVATVAAFLCGMLAAVFYVGRLTNLRLAFAGFGNSFGAQGPAILRFALPTSLSAMLSVLLIWMDRLFIGYFLGVANVGIYQSISQFAILFVVILSSLNAAISPMIAKLYHEQNVASIESTFRSGVKWGLNLTVAMFIVICLIPATLIDVLFGDAYLPGTIPLIVLSVGQLVNVATGAVGLILIMTNHQGRWLWLSIGAIVANVVLNVLLIPRYGLVGAAWATVISLGVQFVGGSIQVFMLHHIVAYDRRLFKTGWASALAFFVGLIVSQAVPDSAGWARLLFTVGTTATVFYGTLFKLGLDEEDRLLWQKVVLRR